MNLCLFGASSADIDTLYVDAIRELGEVLPGAVTLSSSEEAPPDSWARRSEASVKAGAMSQA